MKALLSQKKIKKMEICYNWADKNQRQKKKEQNLGLIFKFTAKLDDTFAFCHIKGWLI